MSSADLVLTGGVVWTGVDGDSPAEALAIRDGVIVAVGSETDVRAGEVGPETEVIDLAGRLVTPGIIDAHTHFVTGGFQLSSVNLRSAATPEEFTRILGEFAASVPPGTWITGGMWDHENWGGELPRAEWVDAVTPEHPVFVTRLDGHMALANSLALQLAGVTAATEEVPGGEIERMPDGSPAGVLKDEAMNLVFSAIPDPSDAEMDRALDAAIQHSLSLGVTQIHDMGTWANLAAYRRAHAEGRLPMRIYSVVPMATWERLRDFVAEEGRGDDRLWWGGLKAFVDGSLGSTTAWFYEPYTDEPHTTGLLTTDTTALKSWIESADAEGLHVIVHAIGDRANDWLLDVYRDVAEAHGPRDRRFRIEHAQHLTPEAMARFRDQEVIPSMQPFHAIDDGRWAEKRIGPDRIRTTYAFRTLAEAGAPMAFGSDWVVAPLSPVEGMYAAVTRRTLDGANPDGWVPEEKVGLEVALRAYTLGSARAGFSEGRVGSLEVGKRADLAVFDRNLLDIDSVEIWDAVVDLTVVDGEVVYRRGN
jgi:predicted amidohydrolase YtcJ